MHLGKCSFQQSFPPFLSRSRLRKHVADLGASDKKDKAERNIIAVFPA